MVGNNTGTIENCYSAAETSGEPYALGGLVGYNDYGGKVTNSFSVGKTTGYSTKIGGLVGHNAGKVTACYFNRETSQQNGSSGGNASTTAQMKQQIMFDGWNFDTVWTIRNGTYPYLTWQAKNYDFAPPLIGEGYPNNKNTAAFGSDLFIKVDEAARLYYVVVPASSPKPDTAQIKAGTDSNGNALAENRKGEVEATENTEFMITFGGLYPSTQYRILIVAEDAAGNMQPCETAFKTLDPPLYTLNYTFGNHGSIFGQTTQTVEWGRDGSEVTAVPDDGYYFVKWSDGITSASRHETDVRADKSLSAVFAPKVPLTITAHTKSKTYGEPDPTLSYEIEEGALEAEDSITGVLERERGENAGTYDILQGTLSAPEKYQIHFVSGLFIINPKLLTASITAENKSYDGNTNADIKITLAGLIPGDDVEAAATGAFINADAGIGKTVAVSNLSLAGKHKDNYTLVDPPATAVADIEKAVIYGVNQMFEVAKGLAHEYSFDLTRLLPSVEHPIEFKDVVYKVQSVTNHEGVLSVAPNIGDVTGSVLNMKVASVEQANRTATITISFESLNHIISNANITVITTDKIPVLISGVTMGGGVYNGSSFPCSGVAVVKTLAEELDVTSEVGPLDVTYEGIGGTTYGPDHTAPKNAGNYRLILSVPEGNTLYTGRAEFFFSISKKPVTVKANDISAYVGSRLPVPTVNYFGFIGADSKGNTLHTEAIAELEMGASTDSTGSYRIAFKSLAVLNNTAGANYTLTHEPGVLTVLENNNNSSGGNNKPTPAPVPTNIATITGSNALNTTLPVYVNTDSSNARLVVGALTTDIFTGEEGTIITIPPISGVNDYTLSISAESISNSVRNGVLTFVTEAGSITLPDNMLTGFTEAEGRIANITIAHGDKSKLLDDVATKIGDRPFVELFLSIDGVRRDWNNPQAFITVSMPYEPTADELANPENIVVWYIDGSGNAISVPNGCYDPMTGTVTFSTTHFSYFTIAYVQKTFGDLGSVEWARKPIEILASKGIISGTGVNTFSPTINISRADYLVLLVKTLGITAEFDDNFDDVEPGSYYYEAIGIAKKLGITAGSGNNRFNPRESISRQDMMVLTVRALEKYKGLKISSDSALLDKFSDKGDIADYAMSSMATLVKEGLIVGSGNKVSPRAYTTRAEAAVFLYKIYNK